MRVLRTSVLSLAFALLLTTDLLAAGSRPAPPGLRTSGPVLLVDGGDTPQADAFYTAAMDSFYGVGGWDLYDIDAGGIPDPPELWLATIRQYRGVVWHSSGSTTLQALASVLTEYCHPNAPEQSPGRLLLIAPGESLVALPYAFKHDVLGVSPISSPVTSIHIPAGQTALALETWLPDLTADAELGPGFGMTPLSTATALYRLEYCVGCYSPRPPFDPIVVVRNPDRETSFHANAITIGVPLHGFPDGDEALASLLLFEWGIMPATSQTGGHGQIHMAISSRGYVGNGFSNPDRPSLRYPYPQPVEHLFVGGPWVGARRANNSLGVSTATSGDASIVDVEELCEFDAIGPAMHVISNDPDSPVYDPDAVAPYQLEGMFNDYVYSPSSNHVPLGIRLSLQALAWNVYPFDDVVVMTYRVKNITGAPLTDLYLGWYSDTTVGNTLFNDPYDPQAPVPWNYHDDQNGAWRPGDWPNDPDNWMMWEHDDDGDDGWATSWVGCRLLGTVPAPEPPVGTPPVSYNAFRFGTLPNFDDVWTDDDGITQPGLYQLMANGDFDAGITDEGDFTQPWDWAGLLATGPFPYLAPNDSLEVTFAMVCGPDAQNLWANARRIADLYDASWVFDPTAVPETQAAGVRMLPAAPNPFNPTTEIRFGLARPTDIDLAIYAVDGRRVRALVQGEMPAGEHRLTWNGQDDTGQGVASGVYLVRLEAAGYSAATQRIVLVR